MGQERERYRITAGQTFISGSLRNAGAGYNSWSAGHHSAEYASYETTQGKEQMHHDTGFKGDHDLEMGNAIASMAHNANVNGDGHQFDRLPSAYKTPRQDRLVGLRGPQAVFP